MPLKLRNITFTHPITAIIYTLLQKKRLILTFFGNMTQSFRMTSDVVNLSCDNFSYVAINALKNLEEDCHFTDVTLACAEGQQLKAHKVILSSCSKFFKNILLNNPHNHPLIYLNDINIENLKYIIYESASTVGFGVLVILRISPKP